VIQSRSLQPYQFIMDETCRLLQEKGIRYKSRVFVLDESDTSPKVILKEVEKKKPDIILTIGSESTLFSSKNISNIPMIFSMVYRVDPIEESVKSNSFLKGVYLNISLHEPLKILQEMNPELKRIGIIYTPSLFQEQVNHIEKEAGRLGILIVRGEIQTEFNIPEAIKDITEKSDAVYLLPDPKTMTADFIKKIMLATYRKKIFVFGESYEWVKKGALVGFAFDIQEVVEKTFQQMLPVVEGNSIADMENVMCKDFRLYLNMRVAEALGIKPGRQIIMRADKTGKVVR
ncbi:MAG: hypothetical protein JW928_04040, partial [Candidatus Aureabacteria bacterium]|nr:hypothetical protein [Candidatus Auribacterota bacterium]